MRGRKAASNEVLGSPDEANARLGYRTIAQEPAVETLLKGSRAEALHGLIARCDAMVARAPDLLAGAFAVAAPRPAARPTLALLKLLLGSANAALSGRRLLGILDPADELVAAQRCDVLPGIERRRVGDQSFAQVFRKSVHHPPGHSRATHKTTVAAILDAREAPRLARPRGLARCLNHCATFVCLGVQSACKRHTDRRWGVMEERDFEGTLVLEQLAEAGRVEDFFDAIDSDDVERAVALMKRAKIDRSTIASVIKKMEDADGEH
jgi:hypothetical protein